MPTVLTRPNAAPDLVDDVLAERVRAAGAAAREVHQQFVEFAGSDHAAALREYWGVLEQVEDFSDAEFEQFVAFDVATQLLVDVITQLGSVNEFLAMMLDDETGREPTQAVAA